MQERGLINSWCCFITLLFILILHISCREFISLIEYVHLA